MAVACVCMCMNCPGSTAKRGECAFPSRTRVQGYDLKMQKGSLNHSSAQSPTKGRGWVFGSARELFRNTTGLFHFGACGFEVDKSPALPSLFRCCRSHRMPDSERQCFVQVDLARFPLFRPNRSRERAAGCWKISQKVCKTEQTSLVMGEHNRQVYGAMIRDMEPSWIRRVKLARRGQAELSC